MTSTENVIEFDLWIEGWRSSDGSSLALHIGKITGVDFKNAVKHYVNTLGRTAQSVWSFDQERNAWSHWGCVAYDNEFDARLAHG